MQAVSQKDQRFWDRIAAKYSRQPISDQDSYDQKLAITQSYFTHESEVFEFGCGTGSTAILHAPHVKHILATDVADNMLAFGRERAAQAGISNITFERAGIEDFEPNGRAFDAILGLNIIHLCKDPAGVMTKVRSMLKPGGYFIQSTVCLKEAMPVAPFILPVMQLVGKAPYVKIMKRDDLFEMVDQAGFEVVETFRPKKKFSAEFIVAQAR